MAATVGGKPAIFISYKRGHEPSLALVAQLEVALAGDFEVLRDAGIGPGDRWSDELWRWLMQCSGAIAVVSDEATASDWCRREWSVLAARASHSGLRVIPVHVGEASVPPDILAHLQAVPADDPAAVDRIVGGLQGITATPPSPTDFLAAHQAWLRWLYEDAPALGGQPFALGDVYVATECGALTWAELGTDRSIDPFNEGHGGRANLLATVLGHFGDPEFRDLVVVQGPAGGGKSAFTIRLARHLMDEGLRPVVVRFRDLRLSTYDDLDTVLQDAIRVAPVGEHPPPPRDPVFGDDLLGETARLGHATISRTVVILDGWDEVELTGSTRFRNQIQELLPRIRQRFTQRPGPPVRVLLTGRPSAIVDRSQLLRKATPVLTVRPMRPDQLRVYAARISTHLDGATWSLDLGRCERAFTSYATWYERRSDDGPDVLGSPLLALLAFRTLADWGGTIDDLFAKPTALYQALIDLTTRHAGKAEDSPEGTVQRGGPALRRLLQRVATVITNQGSESVSFEELRLRLEDEGSLADWAEAATDEGTLHELVVNFYFKSHPELGCEFLHKSFREYLFAEAVVEAMRTAGEGRTDGHPPPPIEPKHDFDSGGPHWRASRSLATLLAQQWLTPEIRSHAFWLLEQAVAADARRWTWVRDLLCDVYAWWVDRTHLRMHAERRKGRVQWAPPPIVEVLNEALPVDGQEFSFSRSTTSADAQLGHALLQLTAFLHSLLSDQPRAGDRRHQSDDTGVVRFRPFDQRPSRVIGRLTAGEHLQTFGLINTYLAATDLRHTNLSGANLAEANLVGAVLHGAHLGGAYLKATNLHDADLREASLAGAYLFQARLDGADLGVADFTGANVGLADVTGADLRLAHLERANLTGARLVGSDLRGADLTGATLTGADLTDADLSGATVTDADLSDADLEGAWLDPVERG